MTIIQTKYTPGRLGLATEYPRSEIPLEYSSRFTNRFISLNGSAEKRQGIKKLGGAIPNNQAITGIHEYSSRTGDITLFASGGGNIYKYDDNTETWSTVLTGKDINSRLISVQMTDKLIFVNGIDRNFYTDDEGITFKELKAVINKGTASSTQTSSTSLTDSNVTSWTADTFVSNNDIIYNSTLNAYGIVTSVGATNLSHSVIGSAASGIGYNANNQQSGDKYEIIDTVELNIIPVSNGKDNFATLTTGSGPTVVAVSGVDFSTTGIKAGDYIYNTTRNRVTAVTTVSANINVNSITSQAVNDTVTFHKSAMPIASYPHVHYKRLYLIDGRERGLVRVSGPDDPEDFTTFANNLEAITQFYTTLQPQAETLLCLKTFQQYLVAGGQRNVYANRGVDPVQDTSDDVVDFSPVGLFPQGCVSRYGIESIGGACIFAANDGLRNFTATFDSNAFQTANISEVIKSELTAAIQSKSDDPDSIQCIHYPRRNWLMFKVGDTIYNYNYTPFYSAGQINSNTYGSFSKFTGKFAEQDIYFIRRNGDLLCAGADGYVYEFDKDTYGDDGNNIITIIESGLLKLNESQDSTTIKTGVYIKPTFETSYPIEYTITAIGGSNEDTIDSVSVETLGVGEIGIGTIGSSPIGGKRIFETKLPLRWKGEQFKVRIETDSTDGPDIITNYVIYGNILGKV